ncbi:putative thiazole-containing bacteriocin maturation protein [Fictibacillus sp. NRS-1165]|uniref:putative thiazole-containing bacteriocin maturation protein n=1 Tax=Fictibacillus sp. NRS-1165 TaxID=3144463 RepID=UPI003D213715
MTNLDPSMRLKVKRDTYFLPDPKGGVYFRNNLISFRMKGSGIDQWVEKLIPMFNGEHTLEDLTGGLPEQYRNRIFEIAETLHENGFIQDISQDRPHQLTDEVLKKYASQIEFLASSVDSGAYRFQTYRQAKVLAVGSGPFLVSLVSALIESGLPKLHVLITDSMPTNRRRLEELVIHARKTDPEVELDEVPLKMEGVRSWRKAVKPFDSILYVSQSGDVEELRFLHTVCREEKKVLLPAICVEHAGMAGPLVHPDSDGCWESAWRRVHKAAISKDQGLNDISFTAGAMLANVIVFEWFKHVTGVTEPSQTNQLFFLDLETLEGNWHWFMPHPLVTGRASAEWIQDLDRRLERGSSEDKSSEMLLYLNQLTSMEAGILHIWEEGDLKQLPLAQCRVQAVDPLSEGPAELLPEMICTGMTHEEARREAGLAGIETYVARMADLLLPDLLSPQDRMVGLHDFVGVGIGETVEEGVCRGLQKCLMEELVKQQRNKKIPVFQVQLEVIEDERCQFYLQSLSAMQGASVIGLGKDVSGFPVVWVRTGGIWYGSAGLNLTLALRKVLQHALIKAQNQASIPSAEGVLELSSLLLKENEILNLAFPACEETVNIEVLQSAMQVLKQNRKKLLVCELELEQFSKDHLAGVFGVALREESSR